jgi:hypothetical protein
LVPSATIEVTPPPGGQVIQVTPAAEAVGWVREGDGVSNHFGDYNIYAGVFDEQRHLGAIQFDLSTVISPGVPIAYADLRLVGLSEQWLAGEGVWTVELLEPWLDEGWSQRSFDDLVPEEGVTLALDRLSSTELAANQANLVVLDPAALEQLEARAFAGKVSFRISGPDAGADNLFSWDSGYGTESRGWAPLLRIVAGPLPDRPPLPPTPRYEIITGTPTPANILTRAAGDATATAQATTTGTPTPLPVYWVTPLVIVPTATPANAATAQWQAAVATALAGAYGTPTPWPPNAWTATPRPGTVVVTNTPTPETWATAVAQAAAEATRRATAGPPTPFPPHVVTATPRYVMVTATPTPQNAATATAISAKATIAALRSGTATPTPANWVTPTPYPLLIPFVPMTNTPTPAPPAACQQVPALLRGKIAFVSDRLGKPATFVMDADGSHVALLTQPQIYDAARDCQTDAPEGLRRVVVLAGDRGLPQLFVEHRVYGTIEPLTRLGGMAYDPAWSPTGEQIAFVSNESGNDEIYLIAPDGTGLRQLTANTWQWDKHPSWSPDGDEIVFTSNRESGRQQIWIMSADGSAPRILGSSPYNDWNPVWLK